jgi:hypothetical protein
LDASVAKTFCYTTDSSFYFKITRFDLVSDLIPGHFYIHVHNSSYRVMRQERPIIILVVVSGLLFLIHQYVQLVIQLNIAFLDNYLDPVVLMPLILYALLWERRLILRNRNSVLSYTDILGYFLIMVLIGEVLFPVISNTFTADYWDIPAYAFGTLSYVLARKVSKVRKLKDYKSLPREYL